MRNKTLVIFAIAALAVSAAIVTMNTASAEMGSTQYGGCSWCWGWGGGGRG